MADSVAEVGDYVLSRNCVSFGVKVGVTDRWVGRGVEWRERVRERERERG